MRNSFSSQLARTVFVYLAILLVTLCAIYPLSNVAAAQAGSAEQSQNSFLRWLGESSLVVLAVAVAGLTLASAIGYTVSRARFLRRRSILAGALIAQLLPGLILSGVFWGVLVWLGLIWSYVALLVIYLATTLPFSLWQMKRNYDAIHISLEEAAEIDGASVWRNFSGIVLPLGAPALAITFLFSLFVAWNEYLIAAGLLWERGIFAAPAGLKIFAGQAATEPGMYESVALLVSAPALLIFLLFSRAFVSWARSRVAEE
jgi:arabinogalactan oligomer/maltooligosaccharide transport system permease protein